MVGSAASSDMPSLRANEMGVVSVHLSEGFMKYPRRQMVKFLAGFLAFTQGTRVAGQYAQRSAASMRLILDGIETVEVIYRGQRVVVTADEVMQSLRETK